MIFLNPILLFGLAAAAIPVMIHLRNRRAVTRVQWGAMRFLKEAVERNQRRMRLEDLLLLLLRIAVVVLLALALARPTLSGANNRWAAVAQPPVTAMLIVDVSGSMQTQTASGETRFRLAVRAAHEAVDALPAGSCIALYTGSDRALALIEQPTSSLAAVHAAIDTLKPTDRATNTTQVVTDALAWSRRQADDAGSKAEILYITDTQRGGTNIGSLADALKSAKDTAHVTLIPIATEAEQNLAVQDLSTGATLAIAGRPVRVVATIANHSDTPAKDVRVSLRIGDAAAPPLDEIVIPEIPPHESRPAPFFARLPTAGRHAITATIAPDKSPFDDARTVVLDARESVRILIAEGPSARAADPTAAPGFFLRQALSPSAVTSDNTPALKVDTARPDELNARTLANADILILAGIATLSPDTATAIKSHVDAGRGLIVFPSDTARSESLEASLADLLPATLESPQGDATSITPRATLARPPSDHPVTQLWSDPAQAAALATVHIYRTVPLRPKQDTRTLLTLSNNTPAILERESGGAGGGKTVLFAIPANTAWSDLPLRPSVFVPLLHRLVAHLATAEDPTANRRVGDTTPLITPPTWAGKEAQLFEPAATTPILTRPEFANTTAQISLPSLDTAGLYRLRSNDEQLLIAATPDPTESDLTRLDLKPLEGIATIAPPGSAMQAGPLQTTDLVLPLALAVLLFAIGETTLAFFFSRPK